MSARFSVDGLRRVIDGTDIEAIFVLAHHAVESPGGTRTLESQVGSGSTFTIRLPASGNAP